jgi:ribosome-associated heat shock protein Hsp15
MAGDQTGRVDSWIWSVRLARTRSAASGACRAGHVKVNGVRVKPAHAVQAGDEVRVRDEGRERVVVVQRVITKRVGAPVAAECYIDHSPPPPPREEAVAVAVRDRGTGRPTKRERRSIEKLLGRSTR